MDLIAELATRALRGPTHIAVVESLTSGALAARIGAGDRAAEWFRGGIVAYESEVKERLLGLGEGQDPCSGDSAEQLARGGQELFHADVTVAVTGIGGPDPHDGHAPGTVYLGACTAAGTSHRLLELDGKPEQVIDASVDAALRMLIDLVDLIE